MKRTLKALTAAASALALAGCDGELSERAHLSEAELSSRPIINGQAPVAPYHDAVVGLLIEYSPTEAYLCSGTLITDTVVLTAAHCVYNTPENGVGFNPPGNFKVLTGKTNLTGKSGQTLAVSGVRYLALAPGNVPVLESRTGADRGPQLYNPNTFAWDLAVLTLKSASRARPIQLAASESRLPPSAAAMLRRLWFISAMPATWLNCAIWATI